MQRKAYGSGVAVLVAILLAGCTASSGSGEATDDAKPGDTGSATPSAAPGKYATLPEPCRQVDQSSLDALLPGLKNIRDEKQRGQAYAGAATVTYDNDRLVGCRWKMDSPDAAHHLRVDFERVVSYDSAVSDDTRADQVFAAKRADARLPGPAHSANPGAGGTSGSGGLEGQGEVRSGSTTGSSGGADNAGPGGSSDSSGGNTPPEGLEPRVLENLGDAAFLDDAYATPVSTAHHRTVTVVFRTSNVIVTVEYDEQPARSTDIPDSKEMQDRAQELAHKLADRLAG